MSIGKIILKYQKIIAGCFLTMQDFFQIEIQKYFLKIFVLGVYWSILDFRDSCFNVVNIKYFFFLLLLSGPGRSMKYDKFYNFLFFGDYKKIFGFSYWVFQVSWLNFFQSSPSWTKKYKKMQRFLFFVFRWLKNFFFFYWVVQDFSLEGI